MRIDAWTKAAGITAGPLFRAVNKGDVVGKGISDEKAIWRVVAEAASTIDSLGSLAPHDLRRTCAKLCRASGGDLEQIQLLLGHASIQTNERYLGTRQKLSNAVNDGIGI